MSWLYDPTFFDEEFPGVLPSIGWLGLALGQSEEEEPPEGDGEGDSAEAEDVDPDPRTPLQKLLERFDLEDDVAQRKQVATWNEVELPKNEEEQRELLREANKKVMTSQEAPDQVLAWEESQMLMDQAGSIDVAPRALAVDTDADVHISQSAIPFPRWHLNPEWLATLKYPFAAGAPEPQEYRSPLMVAEPMRPLEEIDRDGPATSAPHTRIVECIRLARGMIPEVPVKPKGKKGAAPAGTLGWVPYQARGTEGWMYFEDDKSEYGAWFQELIQRKYRDAKAAFEALSQDDAATPKARLAVRYEMRQAAACIAISNQEGAPSAINTYDGLVLSWGIGIAGPGKLPKTFHEITKDPRVYKALYLCGFRYDGTILGGEHHGAYQIVDLAGAPPEDKQASPAPQAAAAPGKNAPPPPAPAVVYRDQWSHGPKSKPRDPRSFEGHAYKVLKYMTSQPKLLHLLIQLAKDPMTRGTIFEPNYRMIQGFAAFVRGEEIHTDALHIFAAQVKHNWGLGPGIVGWAVSRFDQEERRVLPPDGQTSEEKDRAIAKGIVRYLMGRLQQQRWQRALKLMEAEDAGRLADPTKGAKRKPLYRIPATTEFGFKRLIENYWGPLQQGPAAQTRSAGVKGSGLRVPGFPAEVSGSRSDRYVWIEQPDVPPGSSPPPPRYYDLGPLSQFDLLFPHEEIKLIGFKDGLVEIEDNGQRRTVPRDLAPTRGGAR